MRRRSFPCSRLTHGGTAALGISPAAYRRRFSTATTGRIETERSSFDRRAWRGLEQAFNKHKLTLAGQLAPLQSPSVFAALLRTAAQPNWVVCAKRPFAGAAQVLTYLSRYRHRVAIANSRFLSMTEDKVSFYGETMPMGIALAP